MTPVDQGHFSSLVTSIYDAALDADLWPKALGAVTAAIRADMGCLGRYDFRTGAALHPALGRDAIWVRSCAEDQASRNMPWERAARLPVDQVFALEGRLPSPCASGTGAKADGHVALAATIIADGDETILAGALRNAESGPFALAERELFAALLPHLRRAVQMTRRLAVSENAAKSASDVLDQLDHGLIVLTGTRAEISFANAEAAAMLEAEEGLRAVRGTLCARRLSDARSLRRLVAACVKTGGEGVMRIAREGRSPLTILATPAYQAEALGWFGSTPATAFVFVRDPDRAAPPSAERLMSRFGLTQAQADVARELLRGDGLKSAARRLKISPATARTHLARVFEKTGTHRQAELVGLILHTQFGLREAKKN